MASTGKIFTLKMPNWFKSATKKSEEESLDITVWRGIFIDAPGQFEKKVVHYFFSYAFQKNKTPAIFKIFTTVYHSSGGYKRSEFNYDYTFHARELDLSRAKEEFKLISSTDFEKVEDELH